MRNLSVSPAAAALELLKRRRARKNLLDFTTYTMPTYEVNWHHRVVAGYLDKLARLEIRRLMLFMPPRYGKSELVSRRLPAFILGQDPDAPIITASYGADLAKRMNRDVQRIIDDELYKNVFPNTKLFGKNIRTIGDGSWLRNSDEFEVVEYNGYYRGAGVGGAITGMGMKYGIIDDPVKNRQDANSQAVRDGIWDWYTSTFRTRLAPGGGVLITLTRWHPDGLEARLLNLAKSNPKADQWVVVSLPAIADGAISEYDPRHAGEPLWPSRYSLDELEATKAASESEWEALYQQRPTNAQGGIFRKEWWAEGRNRYHLDDKAIREQIIGRWLMLDTAFKDKLSNDPSACTVVELWSDYRIGIRHMWEERLQSALLPRKIEELATQFNYDGKLRGIVIEDKGSGTTSIQTLRMSAPTWLAEMIIEFMPTGTKETRGRLASVWCVQDCVQMPWPDSSNGDWYNKFMDSDIGQLFMFPNAAHDDMTDTFTMAIIYLEHYIAEGYAARQKQKQGQ